MADSLWSSLVIIYENNLIHNNCGFNFTKKSMRKEINKLYKFGLTQVTVGYQLEYYHRLKQN